VYSDPFGCAIRAASPSDTRRKIAFHMHGLKTNYQLKVSGHWGRLL